LIVKVGETRKGSKRITKVQNDMYDFLHVCLENYDDLQS
jgi:hypothetical protein